MKPLRVVVVAVVALTVHGVAVAQQPVGRLTDIVGPVEIDAFGTGRFIRAQTNDALYRESVVRTGSGGRAIARIGDVAHPIAESTTVAVSSLVAAERPAGRGFVRRIVDGIANALGPPRQEAVAAGTDRADRPERLTGSADFTDGVALLRARRFADAIGRLDRIDVDIWPWMYDFSVEDHYAYLTVALIGSGDPAGAIDNAFDFLMAAPAPSLVDRLPPRLVVLVGLAADQTGDERLAATAADHRLELATPESVAFVIGALRVLGYTDDAAVLEREARTQRPGVDWPALLAGW